MPRLPKVTLERTPDLNADGTESQASRAERVLCMPGKNMFRFKANV